MAATRPPPVCAICGADIPAKARACPQCGADERTGWDEQSIYDGLDLPEDNETQAKDHRTRQHLQTRSLFWWAVGALLVVVLALGALGIV